MVSCDTLNAAAGKRLRRGADRLVHGGQFACDLLRRPPAAQAVDDRSPKRHLRVRARLAPTIVRGTAAQQLTLLGRSAQAKSSVWAQMTDGSGASVTDPPIRFFAYSLSRSTEVAQRLYVGPREGGVPKSDGYEVYNKIALAHQLVQIGCCANCRRHFKDASKNGRAPDQLPAKFVAPIGVFYSDKALAK